MTNQVLIVGGRGRIGRSVAQDLLTHYPSAEITITGRDAASGEEVRASLGSQVRFLALDLENRDLISKAVSASDLVVHCAGPFQYRDANVLKTCIDCGVNYVDVSDNRHFTRRALSFTEAATSANVTAIINTGIFPGISNNMVRQAVEQLDKAETIHLSYVVAGSGGAGLTVMRTTFLGLQTPFDVWLDGKWQSVKPYSDRETIDFPAPYRHTGVYWFDMPESLTLPTSFPEVKSVITKFGTSPDLYNHLTWIVAAWWPSSWLKNKNVIEFLSHISYNMTRVTNYFSGTGVAVRALVQGYKDNKPANLCLTVSHDNAAIATGIGTGSVAQLLLNGQLQKPGVWAPEQALSTSLFEQCVLSRGLKIEQQWF